MIDEPEHHGPWIATFRDGPAVGHDRVVAVGPIRSDIYLMPHPKGHTWIRVDFDGTEPNPPWPDQIHYHLAEVITKAGADEPIAYYEIVG